MDARDTFDTVADLYGEIRKGYPAALFDDLAALAGLAPGARVLEVGCGAGQATGDLAARAGHVTALDPGPALIDQARARVPAANIDFVVSGFEGFEAPAASFDLVASAQAWHWIDPAIAFAKAADLLKPGGTLAISATFPSPPASRSSGRSARPTTSSCRASGARPRHRLPTCRADRSPRASTPPAASAR